MTCIVGLIDKGTVYVGGDSAGSAGYDTQIRKDKKVFTKDKMCFGFTSSYRMGQIIQNVFAIPSHFSEKTVFNYLCSDFISGLIKCFKDNGYAEVNNNVVSGGHFLLGYRGELFKIQGDFQVSQAETEYDACGCGDSYALGALRAMESNKGLKPEDRILRALEVAEYFSNGVGRPFHIVKIEKD